MDKLDELKKELEAADRLIGEILDSEPEAERGKYGKKIATIFDGLDWIDFCCIRDERDR